MRLFSFASSGVAVLCALGLAQPGWSTEWFEDASRLTGETSRIRDEAIQRLKKRPQLKKELKEALSTEKRFLALDVITTLRQRSFFKVLLEASETDDTGNFYHALNALIGKGNEKQVRRIYYQRVKDPRTAPASRVALLDSLGRLRVLLTEEELEILLNDPFPEVRQAALYYIRNAVLKLRREEYLDLLELALGAEAYQIRAQALSLVSELSIKQKKKVISEVRASCASEERPELRVLCKKLVGEE